MKFDNVKYLSFDKDGKMANNIFSHNGFEIELNLNGISVKSVGTGLIVHDGSVTTNCYSIKVQHSNIGSREYNLMTLKSLSDSFRCSGIIYHEELDPIGWNLFFEFAKFFLPEREPRCCCKKEYNEVLLPYVNNVLKSMTKHFNNEAYYGNSIWTKDMTLTYYRRRKQ
jgi:hypothetical protein